MDFGPTNLDPQDRALTRDENLRVIEDTVSRVTRFFTGFTSAIRSVMGDNSTINRVNHRTESREVETLDEPNLRMIAGSFNIGKNTKRHPSGEDAHFVYLDEEAVGVADGVGSWQKRGVDAGEYARTLMYSAMEAAGTPTAARDPRLILRAAYRGASHIRLGSSTACIVTHRNGVLMAANVGDSGFLVFRRGELLMRSRDQYHGYRASNSPYQLGNRCHDDRPSCADYYRLKVEADDVVVVATDGVLDNLFVNHIGAIVFQGFSRRSSPQDVAETIVQEAHLKSFDERCVTPWSKKASTSRRPVTGGKRDDITVVVGLIVAV